VVSKQGFQGITGDPYAVFLAQLLPDLQGTL